MSLALLALSFSPLGFFSLRGALGDSPPLLLSLPLLLLSPLLSGEARTLAGDEEFSSMDNAFFIPVEPFCDALMAARDSRCSRSAALFLRRKVRPSGKSSLSRRSMLINAFILSPFQAIVVLVEANRRYVAAVYSAGSYTPAGEPTRCGAQKHVSVPIQNAKTLYRR